MRKKICGHLEIYYTFVWLIVPPFCFILPFFSALLRYNLYTITCKHFKCTVEFWQIILLSHHCPIQCVQFPSPKKVPLCHLVVSPIPHCRIALIWQNFTYKWDHWLCISFLAFFHSPCFGDSSIHCSILFILLICSPVLFSTNYVNLWMLAHLILVITMEKSLTFEFDKFLLFEWSFWWVFFKTHQEMMKKEFT